MSEPALQEICRISRVPQLQAPRRLADDSESVAPAPVAALFWCGVHRILRHGYLHTLSLLAI